MAQLDGSSAERLLTLERTVASLQSRLELLQPQPDTAAQHRQTRLAKTTTSGSYPVSGDTVEIVFLNGSFTETTGNQTPTYNDRQTSSFAIAHNINPDELPPENTVIWVIRHDGQWWFSWTPEAETSDDIFFRISATDTGDATNYWVDKIQDLGTGPLDTSFDLQVAYDTPTVGPGNNEQAQQYIDVSDIAGWTQAADPFELLGHNNLVTKWYEPSKTAAYDVDQDFEMSMVEEVGDVLRTFLDSSEIDQYTPAATEMLGHEGTTQRWFSFSDSLVFDAGEDIIVAVDSVSTPGELQLAIDADALTNYSETNVQSLSHRATGLPIWLDYVDEGTTDPVEDIPIRFDFVTTADGLQAFWDLSAVNDYSQTVMQLFGHFGSGQPNWFELETSPGQTDSSPQVAFESDEDLLLSWFISPSDFKIKLFIHSDHLVGWLPGGEPRLLGASINNIGTENDRGYLFYHFLGWESGAVYTAANDIQIRVEAQDTNKEDLELYFTPDEVPGTNPGALETAAVSITSGPDKFGKTLIDAAGGSIAGDNDTLDQTSFTTLTLASGAGDAEHVTVDTVNNKLILNRAGLWKMAFTGVVYSNGSGTGFTRQNQITLRIHDVTGDLTMGKPITIDLFTDGSTEMRIPFALQAVADLSSGFDVDAQYVMSSASPTAAVVDGHLTAIWLGIVD